MINKQIIYCFDNNRNFCYLDMNMLIERHLISTVLSVLKLPVI